MPGVEEPGIKPIAWRRVSRQVCAWTLGSAVYAIGLSIFFFTGIFGVGVGAVLGGLAWAAAPIVIFLVLYRNSRTMKMVEPLTRFPDGSESVWTVLAFLVYLLFIPMVLSADDAISALVLQAEGREVTAEVVSVESDKRHGNPYQLQRSDGSPIAGEFSGTGQPTWPPGYRLIVVESPSGLVDPRVPEALNPARPLSIFGLSLGGQGAIYALFIVGYRRSKPQVPDHPISAQEILMRARSEAIRDVAFNQARAGEQGYDEREVDTFLDLIQTEFSRFNDSSEVGVGGVELDVPSVVFHGPPPGKRGYAQDEVDAYLDAVEAELTRVRNPSSVDVDSQLSMATYPSAAMTLPSAPMSAPTRMAVLVIWYLMGLLALRSLLTLLLLDSLVEVRRRDTFGVSDESLVRREVVDEVFSIALLVALAVCAIRVRRGARWARITAIVASVLILLGAAIGLSPLYGSIWPFVAVNTLLAVTAVGACFCLIRAGRRAPAPVGSVE